MSKKKPETNKNESSKKSQTSETKSEVTLVCYSYHQIAQILNLLDSLPIKHTETVNRVKQCIDSGKEIPFSANKITASQAD